jgi:hypothetical protein
MPKATHTHTTGCVVTPSRRQLLGGSILAALTGATVGAAIVLPNPSYGAEASPDAHLLALCAEFFRVDTSVEAVPDDALSLVVAARDALAQRISATRAVSAAGLQAKARIGHFLMNERHPPGVSFDDVDSYSLALLDELMMGSVEPFPLPVSHDAELIRLCAECDALQAKIDTLWQGDPTRGMSLAEARTFEKARDLDQQPFHDAQDPLLERICDLRATTPQGYAARARTLIAWDKDPCWVADGCWNSQLLGAIVRDAAGVA